MKTNLLRILKPALMAVLFLIGVNGWGQTSLSPGDIAIIEVNSDGTDNFAFIVLTDIANATQINFTDNGWKSTNSWRTGEGIITWTATGSVSCGTIIHIDNAQSGTVTATAGTASRSGSFDYSGSGDQLIAYQNSSDMVAAINTDGTNWGSDATNANSSAIPQGLSDGSTCGHMSTSDSDNNKYSIASISDTKANVRSSIYNPTNWTKNETTEQNYTGSITVTDCGGSVTAPTVTTSAASGITSASATLNGELTATGGADATERGFYYSTTNGFADGTGTKISSTGTFGTGTFSQTPTGLTTSTTYYFKAFATNSAGTSYGSQQSFLTSAASCTPQTITFGALTAKTYGDATFALTATASSGLAVSYASSNTAVATVSGSTVTIVGAGSTIITASQAGNGTYCAATSVDQSLTVNTKTLTVTGAAATSKTYDGTTDAVITGTLSGIVGADDVTLTGTGTFASANVANGISVTSTSTLGGTDASKYTLTQPTGLTANITKADQTISLAPTDIKYDGDADYTLAASSPTSATNALSYVSSNTAVATIHPTTGLVHVVAVGTTVFTVSQGGNSNYNAAIDATQTLTVDVAPCGSETFDNSNATASYADNSFVGDNSVTWTYVASRNEDTYGITGKGLMLRRTSDGSKVTSSTVSGGIGDFTCSLKKGFTGAGNRQVELFVNGVSKGTSIAWDNTSVQTFAVSGINISGDVVIEIINITANQVVIDDISWSCYAGSINPEPTNHVAGFAATTSSTTHNSITLEWTDATGAQLPDGYLIKASSTSYAAITAPSDGTAEADASLVKNVAYGVETVEFTGLNSNTTYYFKIWPYTNSGSSIDYKTGSEPQATETTDILLVAPTAVAPTNITKTGFTANWNAVSGATSYELDVYSIVSGSNTTDLFISEYIEGSGENKFLEIFNGTGASIDLSNYNVQIFSNGSSTVSATLALSGTLANNSTFVIERNVETLGITADLSTTNAVMQFNGNDALALYKISTSSYVDIFGRIGDDPGTDWTSVSNTTLNKTLVRNSSVSDGVTTSPSGTGPTAFTTLETEWTQYNQDVVSNLGSHTFSGGSSTNYEFQNQSVTGISYAVTGLDSAETYYYVVRAVNTTQTTTNSNEIVLSTKPGAVSDINLSPGVNEVTITWTRGNGDGVLVKVSNAPFNQASQPEDGTDYSGMVDITYSGSGEQWVYDDAGASVVVTLPSSGFDISDLNVAIFEYSTYDDGSKAVNKIYNQGKVLDYGGEEGFLPVNLLSFSAEKQDNRNLILWATASEINNNYFTVERSLDAKSFEEIGTVNGAGTSNSNRYYQFVDASEIISTIYYRLKQTDYDGQFSYSQTIALENSQLNQNLNSAVLQETSLDLIVTSSTNSAAFIKIYSTDGRLLMETKLILNNGKQSYQIDIPSLPSGLYFINLVSDQGVNSLKVLNP